MKIVILAAHCDDETIGVGGLIPKLIAAGHEVIIILGSDLDLYRGKGINNRRAFRAACKLYGITTVHFLKLADQRFDEQQFVDLATRVAELASDADIIITHSARELNRDHKIMAEIAKLIGRPKTKPISILAMEIGGNGPWNAQHFRPNLYIDITSTFKIKRQALKLYTNELRDFPYPTSLKGLEVMAEFRGMESGSRYAEAYEVIRLHGAHTRLLK